MASRFYSVIWGYAFWWYYSVIWGYAFWWCRDNGNWVLWIDSAVSVKGQRHLTQDPYDGGL
jgi:hypothetical protein